MTDLKPLIAKAAAGSALTEDEAAGAFDLMMSGAATPAQIGGLLMALRVRGETVDELVGGVRTMRGKSLKVSAPAGAIDTCGTGGDASGTLNISTAVAFVTAGAGVPVAKHGNKALSSKSGSADVLGILGVKLDIPPAHISRCITDAGVGFMMAPLHHQAMKHVGPARVELGTRTIFNLMGPLTNPAGAKRQLVGVFSSEWVEPVAEVLRRLGSERVWVVHGADGLDEMTITGPTQIAALEDGSIRRFEVVPEDVGLERATLDLVKGGDPDFNAAKLRSLLEGEKGAYRDIVALNSAAALVVAAKAKTLAQGIEQAEQSLASGKALGALEKLVEVSNAKS